MPYSPTATIKPTPVARCTIHSSRYQAGCPDCQKRSAYLNRIAAWEAAHGLKIDRISSARSREHLQYLTTEGNRSTREIAEESGVSDRTIQKILYGHRDLVYPITEQSLLAVQPAAEPPATPQRNLVDRTEGVRLLRGLLAQGWTWQSIADQLGGLTKGAAWAIAANPRGDTWIERGTLDRIRKAAGLLGRYDIAGLKDPLPGMSKSSATAARRRGWHPIKDWIGLDITDPDADPDAPPPADLVTELLAGLQYDRRDFDESGLSFVDPILIRKVTETAERIKTESPAEDGRAGDLYIPPLTLRWLELHAVWWHAESAGLNGTQIGMLLGYDMGRDGTPSFDAGQRQVNRIRERMIAARAVLDGPPREWLPTWFNQTPKPIGKPNFAALLPALLAIQPAPLGAGMTVAQLAASASVDDQELLDFLRYASREGERPWNRNSGPPKRTRRRTARCAPATQAAA